MKIWSWSVNDWNVAFQVMTIIFGAGTILTGVGAFWTDRIIKGRDAAELEAAKTSTARVETDLAKQQERTAKAEKDLLAIQEKFHRRTLTQQERDNIVGLLHSLRTLANEAKEKGEIFVIVHPAGDGEATEFANLLGHLFIQAGWFTQVHELQYAEHTTGMAIVVGDLKNLPLYAQVLQIAFRETKLSVSLREDKVVDSKRTYLEVSSLH